MHKFNAEIKIIGVNPFVFVPEEILAAIFKQAGKDKGAIPISGTVNNVPYKQTLIRYSGEWRLYINTKILENSPARLGETIQITISFDPESRTIPPHPKLLAALNKNKKANAVFQSLSPSLQKEIIRYINMLKTEASIDKNVTLAIDFLLGKVRFIGRDKLEFGGADSAPFISG